MHCLPGVRVGHLKQTLHILGTIVALVTLLGRAHILQIVGMHRRYITFTARVLRPSCSSRIVIVLYGRGEPHRAV